MSKTWDLSERTMEFAVAVFRVCKTVSPGEEAHDIVRQLRRAAGAVGANYRSAKRAKSRKDFANKLSVVIEEADEVGFWLDLSVRVDLMSRASVTCLMEEASELVAIFTTSQKTARAPRAREP